MNGSDRILRPREVCALVGYTNQHLRRLERKGVFPPRFPLYPGARAVGWRLSDIEAWIKSRAGDRGGANARISLCGAENWKSVDSGARR